jgi:acyl-CoA thioester hydrolase
MSSQPPAPFTHQFRVRWSEVDAQGVVFNGHYLNYADVAGTEYFREAGVLDTHLAELGEVFVVDARLSFKSPAHNDDILTSTVRTERIGTSSFTLLVELHREQTLLTEIRLTYVRAPDGKPTPLSDGMRACLGR